MLLHAGLLPLLCAWAGDGLEDGNPDHNLVQDGAHGRGLCQLWKDRWGKYTSGTDCCGRWDSHSIILFQKFLSICGPTDSQLWSYRHLECAKVGPLFRMDWIYRHGKYLPVHPTFPMDFPHSFMAEWPITRITTSNKQMTLCKEMWRFTQTQDPRLAWSSPKTVTLSSYLQKKWQRCWKILELVDEKNLCQIQLLSSLR